MKFFDAFFFHTTTTVLLLLLEAMTILVAAEENDNDVLTILTINFACRDIYPLAACDNCQTRFDLIADAFLGSQGEKDVAAFEGLPNLDEVDVIIGQELGTSSSNKYEQITTALASRGFIYTTGDPSPTPNDSICNQPLIWGTGGDYGVGMMKGIANHITGLQNGGLVTWSRYPILETHSQNWCSHGLPIPSGYLATLLDVGQGRVATVINLHAMPEYDLVGFPNYASGIRSYQFGEIGSFATTLSNAFVANNVPFSIILGGDFNEDAYNNHLSNSNTDSSINNCQLIADTDDLVKQKFNNIGFDLVQSCEDGLIGTPTWNPSTNDLANRFSGGRGGSTTSSHEVLDYLIQHSSSEPSQSAEAAVKNVVSTFKTKNAWNGKFCHDSSQGEAKRNNIYYSTAFALSDHEIVTASFTLPPPSTSTTTTTARTTAADAIIAFNNAINNNWNSPQQGGGLVDQASCGQDDSICWTDSDCCSAEYSWNTLPADGTGGKAKDQHCNGYHRCSPCASIGESCGIQFEGSECCGYNDYSTSGGQGTHCQVDNLFTLEATCILKFAKGKTCLWDEECQSNSCSWTWFRGKKCD